MRSEQGLPLPLPSVVFYDEDHDDGGNDVVMYGLLRVMVEGPMAKELVRMIVSFI